MNNIESVKAGLEQAAAISNIINPPVTKTKKTALPRAKDIKTIEDILDEKIRNKENQLTESLTNREKAIWKARIEPLHLEMVNLVKKFEQLVKDVHNSTNGMFKTDDGYRCYWHNLPKTVGEAEAHNDMLELDQPIPQIEAMKKHMQEIVLDMKIGIRPLTDVKALLEEIDKIV